MKSEKIIPIILSGGSGSRLWPLSRESFPKQYLTLLQGEKKTLLQQTLLRIQKLNNIEQPIIICNEEHRFIVAEQMRGIKHQPKSILLEPFGKNTAPAICLASLKALEHYEDPILLVLSADHAIKNSDRLLDAIRKAVEYAKLGKLITFGVPPNYANTGYGYIKTKDELDLINLKGHDIVSFHEKPDKNKANEFIKDKRFSWNSGIFLFKANTILQEFKKYSNELVDICKESLQGNLFDLDFQRLNKDQFKKCNNISIDNAVFEKTDLGMVIPLDAGWSDIGSWRSIWDNEKKDENGNVLVGKVIDESVKNCLIRSDDRLIVGMGIENLIVIDTNDAILIANKDNSEDIKALIQKIDLLGPEVKTHKKVYRPWGHYTSIANGSSWQLKRIEVKPNGKLSLQLHHHRSEHWIIVSGQAEVQINEEKKLLHENQSVYIPLGSKHRLTNSSNVPLVLIEVQSGKYLGEDDIVRFEDKYGRSR